MAIFLVNADENTAPLLLAFLSLQNPDHVQYADMSAALDALLDCVFDTEYQSFCKYFGHDYVAADMHVFTDEEKKHIFYHICMINKLLP